jgi:hypothetical protein
MNFNMIKRFDIKNGSYILWTGEPTGGDQYHCHKMRAAPLGLVDDQLGSVTSSLGILTNKIRLKLN